MLDCFLYALTAGVNLKLIINRAEWEEVPVGDFLQEALPNVRLNVPKPEPGTEWLVVLTASSFAPWAGQSMKTLNHWIPAFRAARADKEIWMRRASEEVEKHVAQAHAEAAAEGSDPEQILQGECKTGNYIRFVKRLLAHEILCFDVPGFGDCGCHALFALMQERMHVYLNVSCRAPLISAEV